MSTTGDLEGAHECLVDWHHPASVVKLPAVVGGREQGHLRKISFQFFNISFRQKFFCQNYFSNWFLFKSHQLTLGKELVTILYHLSQERFKSNKHYAATVKVELAWLRPGELCIWGQDHVCWGTWRQRQLQMWSWLRGHSRPTPEDKEMWNQLISETWVRGFRFHRRQFW